MSNAAQIMKRMSATNARKGLSYQMIKVVWAAIKRLSGVPNAPACRHAISAMRKIIFNRTTRPVHARRGTSSKLLSAQNVHPHYQGVRSVIRKARNVPFVTNPKDSCWMIKLQCANVWRGIILTITHVTNVSLSLMDVQCAIRMAVCVLNAKMGIILDQGCVWSVRKESPDALNAVSRIKLLG